MPTVAAVVVAAGAGLRLGSDRRKPFVQVLGRSLLDRSLEAIHAAPGLRESILVVRPDDRERLERDAMPDLRRWGVTRLVEGGARRQDSVENGARTTDADVDLILVHDAARPLVRPADVARVVEAAAEVGAAVLAVPARDTIKRADDEGLVAETPNRRVLWQAQTPQVVRRDWLLEGLERARRTDLDLSDDVAAAEILGRPVRLVGGHRDNVKVTVPEDLAIVEALLHARERGHE